METRQPTCGCVLVDYTRVSIISYSTVLPRSNREELNSEHSNLPKMPGQTFPYRMTPNEPLGLIFNHYDYGVTFDNDIIEQTFIEAAHEINREIAQSPSLANQTMDVGWAYDHDLPDGSEDYYQLSLHPDLQTMKYQDIPILIAVLATWARQYRTVETDFEIWARPGTRQQRRLGYGMLLLIY